MSQYNNTNSAGYAMGTWPDRNCAINPCRQRSEHSSHFTGWQSVMNKRKSQMPIKLKHEDCNENEIQAVWHTSEHHMDSTLSTGCRTYKSKQNKLEVLGSISHATLQLILRQPKQQITTDLQEQQNKSIKQNAKSSAHTFCFLSYLINNKITNLKENFRNHS
jgi:hypothetical protein